MIDDGYLLDFILMAYLIIVLRHVAKYCLWGEIVDFKGATVFDSEAFQLSGAPTLLEKPLMLKLIANLVHGQR